MIVFIDTNVFLDVLLNREGLAEGSEKVLNICSAPGFRIHLSSISFANITYFLARYRKAETKKLLLQLLNSAHVADTSAGDFEKALNSNFTDLEDAYQYYTALKIRGIKYFITRNVRHYKKTAIPVVTPEQFLRDVEG